MGFHPLKNLHGETSLFIPFSFLNVYPIKKWGNNLEIPDYKLGNNPPYSLFQFSSHKSWFYPK